jgi:2Fe-2S ferredoxin
MPKCKVTFLPENKTVEVDTEAFPYGDHGEAGSLLDIAMKFGIGLDHACGGVCACSTCHIHVKSGAEHLTEIDEETRENDMLDQARDVRLESRLGCQAVLKGTGDVVVEIPAWNRNLVREGNQS